MPSLPTGPTGATRIAVLGAGFMGGTHARAYATLPDVEIAAIFAHSGNRAEPLAAELGAAWTSDPDRILRDDSIQAVDICLPTPEHRPMLEAALEAGKHVLLEKPLALTEEDARALVSTVESSDRIVMIAHVLRFWPEYVELRRVIDSGELGRPRSGNTTRRQPFPAWSTLFKQADITGGAIFDMLIHDYDALNWVLGSPRAVTAHGLRNPRSGGFDHAQVLVDYGDATGIADGGMMMPESFPFTSRIEILCERGAVEYHFQAGGRSFEVGEPTNTLTIYRNDGDPDVVSVAQSDPYTNEVAYFIDCVRSGAPAERATVHDAYAALRVGLAAKQSAETGSAVTL
jgi:predicted dehydrogenase